jgi:tRNA (guanine-N7-)-methyltransferase
LDRIAAKLKPGGEFRFGTDHPIYCRWAMMQMNRRTDFIWQAQTASDFLVRPDDWPETRYARKARTVFGHDIWYFRYIRV